MAHKSGFVNIIGNPNVGKSTLMNEMVGERLSIITSKAQTTRHRIMGIVSGEDFQIVYSDTPGIIDPKYKLQESMMGFVQSAMLDADVFLYVVEVKERTPNKALIEKLEQTKTPVLLLINKMDLSNQDEMSQKIEFWKEQFPEATIIPISALHKFNLDLVFDTLIKLLPESPAYYPKEDLTDKSMRFIVSEIIREKILIHYKKEIPYSVEIIVDSYIEEPEITRISATIYVIRESQRGILLGHKGAAIKRVGTEARKDIERFIDKKVFLETFVKVKKDWRNNERDLKQFGYQQ